MAFHWKDGWYFERLADGSVRIYHEEPVSEGEGEYDVVIDIDPDSWASIVASVSSRRDTAESFQLAQSFHMGVEEPIPMDDTNCIL